MSISKFSTSRDEPEQKPDNKMDSELQKAVKNIEATKSEVKSEMDVKTEMQEPKQERPPSVQGMSQMFSEGVQRVMSQNQQMALQVIAYLK